MSSNKIKRETSNYKVESRNNNIIVHDLSTTLRPTWTTLEYGNITAKNTTPQHTNKATGSTTPKPEGSKEDNSDNDTEAKFKPHHKSEKSSEESQAVKPCHSILKLYRVENGNYAVQTGFTVGYGVAVDMFNITEGRVAMVRFDLSEIKDIGSTLQFVAELKPDLSEGSVRWVLFLYSAI